MTALIYVLFGFVLLYIGTTAVFLFLRKLDQNHIEKQLKEIKELRSKNIKIEVSKMALIRQIDAEKAINKRLQEKIRATKNLSFEETLNEL